MLALRPPSPSPAMTTCAGSRHRPHLINEALRQTHKRPLSMRPRPMLAVGAGSSISTPSSPRLPPATSGTPQFNHRRRARHLAHPAACRSARSCIRHETNQFQAGPGSMRTSVEPPRLRPQHAPRLATSYYSAFPMSLRKKRWSIPAGSAALTFNGIISVL